MFDGLKRIWKGIRAMFSYSEVKNVVGKDVTLSQSMIDAINDWKQMLDGKATWIVDPIKSLRIEEGICREFADVVLVEMESSVSVEKLDKAYQRCIANLNENLQEGLGLGSFVLKPLGELKYEFVTADKFIPIKFSDEGKPLDIAFLTVKRIGDNNFYTKIERHYLQSGNLAIENKCYHSMSREHIGRYCELTDVDEWKKIEPGPVVYPGMEQMDFGYYRNPIKNKIDDTACGVSIFESAKERIKIADIQAARLDWEYESGERAIHVDERALKKSKGNPVGMAKFNKRLYRGLNIDDGKDKELLKEYSPEMRDESFVRGLEKQYRTIEFIVGLAYGDLSDVQEVSKTATEIKTSKARKYNRVNAIQCNLEWCLTDFVAGLAFHSGLYTSGYEFNCKFNDSILTDEEMERQQDLGDMAAGILAPYQYRMKWYNEDEATAKANLPEQNAVMGDDIKIPDQTKKVNVHDPESGTEVQGKQLNGAQTHSLIAIMAQFSSKSITEGQAVNLIATSIGISKDEAKKILNGDIT